MEEFYSEEEKNKYGLGGGETAAQSPTPAEPKVLKPEDVTASGDSNLEFYGSKARATNQKTGAQTWYDVDANGGLTERKDAPVSMQIAANGGIAPDDDAMRKFEKYNRMKREEKAKARAGYNKVIADTLGGALDQVYRNETIREHNGQKYRVGIVDADALAGANTQLGKLGKNTIKKIFAMQQVAQTDANQMLGEPQFVVEFNEDGVTKSDGKRIARMFTRSQIENIIRKSYEATGEASRGEDVIKALFRDRAGEIKAEKEAAEKKAAETAALAEKKRQFDEAQRIKQMEARAKVLEAVAKREDRSKPLTANDLYKAIVTNKEALAFFSNVPEVDDKGVPVFRTEMDENGNEVQVQVMRRASPAEVKENIDQVFAGLTDAEKSAGREWTDADYIAYAEGGESGNAAVAPKAEGVQGSQGGVSVQERAKAIQEKRKLAAQQAQVQQTQRAEQPVQQTQTQQPVVQPVEIPVAKMPVATQSNPEPAAGAENLNPPTADYGLRNDGKTNKGTGWLGELKTADGGVATEYTVGVNIGGKEMDIPTLVPTLTKDEVDLMVNDIIPNKKPVPDAIMQKAADHAKKQLANGQSVFANDGQPTAGQTPTAKQGQFVPPTSLYNKEWLDAVGDAVGKVLREAPTPTPAATTEQPVQTAEPKRTEYTPAPNPRAKASRSIVTDDGRKRQRGLDMSGTGYADKVAAIIDSEERKADRRESRIATLMADAQREYRDWQSNGRKGDFKFSNQDELDVLIKSRLGNKDYDADVAEIVRNRLANQWLDEVRNTDYYKGVKRGSGKPPRTLDDIQRDIDEDERRKQGRRDAVANPAFDESSERLRGLYDRMKKKREEEEARKREERKRIDRILGIKRK